jgi:hypothetical protein
MTEEVLRSRIQLVTQVAAIFAVISYAAGFLTISLHNASLGILQQSLLRPKILSAGILFLVLTGLPVLEAARNFGYWNLGPRPDSQDRTMNAASGRGVSYYLPFLQILNFLVAATAVSVVIRPFLEDYTPTLRTLKWNAIMIAAVIAAIVYLRRQSALRIGFVPSKSVIKRMNHGAVQAHRVEVD